MLNKQTTASPSQRKQTVIVSPSKEKKANSVILSQKPLSPTDNVIDSNNDSDGNVVAVDSDGISDNGNDINADGIQHIDAAAAYFILCMQKNSGDESNGDLKNDDADDAGCNGNDNDGYKQWWMIMRVHTGRSDRSPPAWVSAAESGGDARIRQHHLGRCGENAGADGDAKMH